MREIGSEFWDVPLGEGPGLVLPPGAQWYLSGRAALSAILKQLPPCRSAALPSWCCDSMIKPFLEAGMEVRFYPVWFEKGSLRQEIDWQSDVTLILDYFGYSLPGTKGKARRGVVIRDVTHSMFSASYEDADYYFGSLRKWTGVWTGGFAWAADGRALLKGSDEGGEYICLRRRAMELKRGYIAGDMSDKQRYLSLFARAEEALETSPSGRAHPRDVEAAGRLDTGFLKSRRRQNAQMLMEALGDWLIFPRLLPGDCPLMVPVLVPGGQRDALRKYLIKDNVFCPVHWPVSEYHRLESRERFIYDNELSLVCDQRYTTEDMARAVEAIRAFERTGAKC